MWGEPKDKQPLSDDIPKYRKKKQRKTPKKSNHKHEYEDIIVKYWNPHRIFNRERGFIGGIDYSIAQKCIICGRIDNVRLYWRTSMEELLVEYPGLEIIEVDSPFSKSGIINS